jgi:glycosyltransferase involved in cell wall biosynthesis
MSRHVVVVASTIFAVRGGIPRFNQMLCLALDRLAPRLDLAISVLSQDDSDDDYRRAGAPWRHARFHAGAGKLRTAARALRLCARERPELLLIGLLGMTPVGLLCLPFVRGGFGFVAHGYECWDELQLRPPKRSRRFTARRARFVLSVSQFTGDALARSVGIPRAAIRLLPNTLDPGFEGLPVEDDAPTASGPPELLTVSRLWVEDPLKGVDHALRAFARLLPEHPGLVFRIVGKGSDKPRLVELARRLDLGRRVVFEEDLSDGDLAERYRRCSIFVLPSGQEGFGIVFLEAMRFARPCVGGRAGGTPEVIEDGATGLLVPYGDEPALASALARLLHDPALARAMGRAGRRRLEQHFVFSRFEERLEGHLRELLPDAG